MEDVTGATPIVPSDPEVEPLVLPGARLPELLVLDPPAPVELLPVPEVPVELLPPPDVPVELPDVVLDGLPMLSRPPPKPLS